MIKVCQVVSDTNIGGAGRYLLNYLKYFDREKYKVSVVIPTNSDLLEFIAAYQDVEIYEMPYMADKSYDKRCVKALAELFKKEAFDIIHTHASLSARIAGRKAKVKKIIATRHCIEPKGSFPVSLLKSFLNNRLCDYYIAVSDAVAENLKDCGIATHKIKKVFNGVEPQNTLNDEEKAKIKEQYNIGEGKVFSVFARLEEVKGHKYFIDAAKAYLSKGNKGTFLIVGDGSLKDDLKELAKDTPEIIFTGYVKSTQELLNITDVNVISSSSEAMSLAILEAMSLGKPTIATNVGGNPQLVINEETGLLVEYANAAQMSEAFLKMSTDEKLYRECSENARGMFYSEFKAEIMVKNLQKLYWEAQNGKN